MRRSLILLMLAACESKDDFPAAPQLITWQQTALGVQEGKLEGTGYAITVPRSAVGRLIGDSEVRFETSGLTVTVRIEAQSLPFKVAVEQATGVGVEVMSQDVRHDGWVIAYDGGRAVFGHAYVDDGAFTCNAIAQSSADPATTPALLAICKSLEATTPLANPNHYGPGLSPHELRTALCEMAIGRVRWLESEPPKTRKRKTAKQLEAVRVAKAELDAAYAARQRTCEQERWDQEVAQCLIAITRLEQAKDCVASW